MLATVGLDFCLEIGSYLDLKPLLFVILPSLRRRAWYILAFNTSRFGSQDAYTREVA